MIMIIMMNIIIIIILPHNDNNIKNWNSIILGNGKLIG